MVGTEKDHPQSFIDRTVKYSLQTQISLKWREATRSNDQKYVCVRRLKPSGAMFKHFQCPFFFRFS